MTQRQAPRVWRAISLATTSAAIARSATPVGVMCEARSAAPKSATSSEARGLRPAGWAKAERGR
ncbi:hypothetical protein [Streptomyces shaanxiensis]|uniref:hypothetical protein n=1 Tax=Streptomyces shaanxiensis TaxID=653357 RepID=UPI0031EFC0F6